MFRFPWGDFHSLNLGWFLQKFNELLEDWATAEAGIDGALDAEIQKAEDALTDVFAARDAAAASASAANSSALNASQSSIASMDARDQSRAARDAAQQAAGNAAASETAAGNSATAASNSAGAAATSATQAGNSATAAGNSATAAGQSATNAAASETAAGNSAAAAAASETAAGNSATDAEEAAASVEASAQQIATNTSDIANLKNAISYRDNLLPSPIFPLNKMRQKPYMYASVGRRIENNSGIYTIIFTQSGNPTIIISGNPQDNINQAGTGTANDALHFVKGNYKVKVIILNTDNKSNTFMFNVLFKLPDSTATYTSITIDAGKNIVEKPITITEDVDLCVFLGLLASYLGTTAFVLTIEPIVSTTLSTNATSAILRENNDEAIEETK